VQAFDKSFGFILEAFADVFVGREAVQSVEVLPIVIGIDESAQMGLELLMIVVVVAFEKRLVMACDERSLEHHMP